MERRGRPMCDARRHLSSVAVAAGLSAVVLAGAAHAQPIDCSDPDNLCTGDPCVISGPIAVQSPCVADFGTRALRCYRWWYYRFFCGGLGRVLRDVVRSGADRVLIVAEWGVPGLRDRCAPVKESARLPGPHDGPADRSRESEAM